MKVNLNDKLAGRLQYNIVSIRHVPVTFNSNSVSVDIETIRVVQLSFARTATHCYSSQQCVTLFLCHRVLDFVVNKMPQNTTITGSSITYTERPFVHFNYSIYVLSYKHISMTVVGGFLNLCLVYTIYDYDDVHMFSSQQFTRMGKLFICFSHILLYSCKMS